METYCSLEDKVRAFLCETYELDYNSTMKYIVRDTTHILEWTLNDQDHPYVMMGDFESEDSFFEYIKKEIKRSRIFLRGYSIAKMNPPA